MNKNIPILTTVYLYLTNRCNLHCRHCWINPMNEASNSGIKGRDMDIALLKDILRQCRELGMRSLKITGGEPVLYDSFMKLLEYASGEEKKGPLFLHMETNGTMIDKKMARVLKKSGMKFVSVSIDGDNAATHESLRGVKGSFEKSWQAVRYMIKEGIPVQIITAIHRGNYSEFKNVITMAEREGAESVKANVINTMGRGMQMEEQNELLSVEETIDFGNKIEREYREKFKIRVCSSMPIAFQPIKRLLEEKRNFCKIKSMLGILATGKISICGIGEEVKSLIFGDAKKDRIKDIWRENKTLWDIRNNLPCMLEGVCKICVFKDYCLGHCVAQTYRETESFTAPFSLCQRAYDKGLFPKSRLYEKLGTEPYLPVLNDR